MGETMEEKRRRPMSWIERKKRGVYGQKRRRPMSSIYRLACRVSGFGVRGSGFGVRGSGLKRGVWCLGLTVSGVGCKA
jgi:hypothetical protein